MLCSRALGAGPLRNRKRAHWAEEGGGKEGGEGENRGTGEAAECRSALVVKIVRELRGSLLLQYPRSSLEKFVFSFNSKHRRQHQQTVWIFQ